jgi:hypothetical protein
LGVAAGIGESLGTFALLMFSSVLVRAFLGLRYGDRSFHSNWWNWWSWRISRA